MAYSVEYVPAAVVESLRTSTSLAIFLRVDTDPGLHLYFGVNDLPVGFDSIDPAGTVYMGGGRLQGIPNLEVLVNGRSSAINFTVSGIEPRTGAKVIDSLPPVRGKLVQVGLTTLDKYHQPVSNIVPIWTGIASHPEESQAPVREGENPTLSLSLAVVGGENTRSRPSRSLWSDAMQQAERPGDLFCKNTGAYARGIQPKWPIFRG